MLIGEILSRIQRDYQGGMTQVELSQKYNITQQHINSLLSGKRSIEKMGVGTFLKMFPRATINLDGEPLAQSVMKDTVPAQPEAKTQREPLLEAFLGIWKKLLTSEKANVIEYAATVAESKSQRAGGIAYEHKNLA